ncbi:hypothetical protein LA284_001990 [Vibrio vulnificus]|nr:hypothetical protein [Vibrio vulnificus]EID0716927.1 hypothetical protein [Vibrio vulnificus]EID0741599.1 hypothetical protein [Vibrio vulnificus]EJL7818195.1 hypothetical protein [Vibrio vulnificus]
MKLYFLVEGRSSELQTYPEWLRFHLPNLTRYTCFNDFKSTNKGYMLFSGEGYPSILDHIPNAVEDVRESLADYLFIILDSDEEAVDTREKVIQDIIVNLDIPTRTEIVIVVQNRCFETLLLGNRQAVPRKAQDEPLITYYRYFNAYEQDPELLGNYDDDYTHSQFHAKYAKTAIRQKGFIYSKSRCSSVSNPKYFENICKRYKDSNELKSLTPLIEALENIAKNI